MSSAYYLAKVIFGLPIGIIMFFLGLFFYYPHMKKNSKPAIKTLWDHNSLALMFIGGVIIIMAIIFAVLSFVS